MGCGGGLKAKDDDDVAPCAREPPVPTNGTMTNGCGNNVGYNASRGPYHAPCTPLRCLPICCASRFFAISPPPHPEPFPPPLPPRCILEKIHAIRTSDIGFGRRSGGWAVDVEHGRKWGQTWKRSSKSGAHKEHHEEQGKHGDDCDPPW